MFAVPGWNVPTDALRTQTVSAEELAKKAKKNEQVKALKAKKKDQKKLKNASEGNQLPLGKKRKIGNGEDEDDGDGPEEEPVEVKKAPAKVEEKKVQPKQKDATPGLKITDENLQSMYEKVVEGVAPAGKKKRKRGTKGAAAKAAAAAEGEAGADKEDGEGEGDKAEDKEKADPSMAPPSAKKQKKEKKKKDSTATDTPAATAYNPSTLDSLTALTPLQQKMRAKLTSARFRHLNETLYTKPSEESFSLFREQPAMFNDYHAGFRQQVTAWPENPVDIFISSILKRSQVKATPKAKGEKRPENALRPLPRPPPSYVCTIADLGCGDAKLAATVLPLAQKKKLKIDIKSFDLSNASNPKLVTEADIANLPLENESVDIAIFCLALMGTNYLDFIEEAFRVLRFGGELWVAEIKSRFAEPGAAHKAASKPDVPANKGKIGVKKVDDTPVPVSQSGDLDDFDLLTAEGNEPEPLPITAIDPAFSAFITALGRRGFVLRGNVDDRNKMFVRMEFFKPRPKLERTNELKDNPDYDFSDTRAGKGTKQSKTNWYKGKKGKGDETEEDIRKREEKILKPCVYKLR